VGDEQGRDSRTGEAFAQNGGDLGGGLDVEGGSRLVEDEDVGTEDERAGEGDARGLPAANPVATGVISPQNTNALGYKPNNPGDVPIGKPFLLGTVRHNNFQVHSASQWVHSSIDVNIGGIEDSFPFDQEETEDDTDTTAALSDEGAYMLASRANGPNSCPANAPYAALNRDAGSGVWYCYRHVGKGRGNRDIFTNNPAACPARGAAAALCGSPPGRVSLVGGVR